MENNSFHTSFIPKKPMVSTDTRQAFKSSSFNILSFFVGLLVVGAFVVVIGMYFYKDYLNKEIESKSNSLAITRENLEEGTLVELQSFNRRLNSSKKILANHTVISPFFEILGTLTLPEVQFNNFSGVLSNDGKGLAVTMGGLAKDYRTVAVQSDIFNSEKAKFFNDVSFADLSLSDGKNTKGLVNFTVSFFVDPSFLSFENNILKYKDNQETNVIQESNLENLNTKEDMKTEEKDKLLSNKENIQ